MQQKSEWKIMVSRCKTNLVKANFAYISIYEDRIALDVTRVAGTKILLWRLKCFSISVASAIGDSPQTFIIMH